MFLHLVLQRIGDVLESGLAIPGAALVSEMGAVAPVAGVPWTPGAIGNASWTGVSLAAVLRACGAEHHPSLHVAFACADTCELEGKRFNYGASIPIEKAMTQAVLLAWAMNGETLTPENGYPLRVVVQGYAGELKWLLSNSGRRSDMHLTTNLGNKTVVLEGKQIKTRHRVASLVARCRLSVFAMNVLSQGNSPVTCVRSRCQVDAGDGCTSSRPLSTGITLHYIHSIPLHTTFHCFWNDETGRQSHIDAKIATKLRSMVTLRKGFSFSSSRTRLSERLRCVSPVLRPRIRNKPRIDPLNGRCEAARRFRLVVLVTGPRGQEALRVAS